MVSASNRYILVPFSVVMRIIFEFGEKQNSPADTESGAAVLALRKSIGHGVFRGVVI